MTLFRDICIQGLPFKGFIPTSPLEPSSLQPYAGVYGCFVIELKAIESILFIKGDCAFRTRIKKVNMAFSMSETCDCL